MLKCLLLLCLWIGPTHKHDSQTEQVKNGSNGKQGVVEPSSTASSDGQTYISNYQDSAKKRGYASPEWIIVYITLAYTLVSIGSLSVIWNQNSSIQNTERAVLVPLWENYIHVNPDEPTPKPSHCFTWNFTNWGKTPGFVESTCAEMVVINSFDELPKRPKYEKLVFFKGDPIAPQKSLDFQLYAPMRDTREYAVIEADYRTGGKILYVFGCVKYRDMFGRKHETRFGIKYRAAPESRMYYDGFFVDGPKAYNEYK